MTASKLFRESLFTSIWRSRDYCPGPFSVTYLLLSESGFEKDILQLPKFDVKCSLMSNGKSIV